MIMPSSMDEKRPRKRRRRRREETSGFGYANAQEQTAIDQYLREVSRH